MKVREMVSALGGRIHAGEAMCELLQTLIDKGVLEEADVKAVLERADEGTRRWGL